MKKWAKNTFMEFKTELDNRAQGILLDSPSSAPVPPIKPVHLQSPPPSYQEAVQQGPQPITANDIVRYRYQYGMNLGSVFVLEKWMFGSMFHQSAKGGSELDAVKAAIKTMGFEAACAKFREHWENALTDADFKFLTQTAHITTIRLPIGYFTLGPNFCSQTPFQGKAAELYTAAWPAVVSLISRCAAHGIAVLIDFHAVPGGANTDSHSGTSSGKAQLWSDGYFRDLALSCLRFMALEISSRPELQSGVITGLQLCNEASGQTLSIYPFYDQAISMISAIDPTIPIYISDDWNLASCLTYTIPKNNANISSQCPIIIDTHRYFTFSATDRAKDPYQIIHEVQTSQLHELNPSTTGNVFEHSGAASIFIGEYSVTLDTATWARVDPSLRPDLTRQFGLAQTQLWHAKTMGSTYWSYKFDWGGPKPGHRGMVHTEGGDWGFRNQVDNHAVEPTPLLTFSRSRVEQINQLAFDRHDALKQAAYDAHVEYWARTSPDVTTFRHELYAEGYELGYSDSHQFFAARLEARICSSSFTDSSNPDAWLGADGIGALDMWVLKRMKECGMQREREQHGWEWEQGFRRGVSDFGTLCLT